ncbi:transmembrane protein 222 isoform X1 [Nomascus leucogenys]|uniref:transmembrane protein 222 isoform X1 n=1 Tax=Nomascus leucogenys TaxID=61853 RepID=UPI00122D72D7|nr:transmembrane protein 222 isoform X1 [Nomascus leucogenys]
MWNGVASPTAWCGRPSRCSRGFSPSSATWASAHPQESFGTSRAPTLSRRTIWPLESLPNSPSCPLGTKEPWKVEERHCLELCCKVLVGENRNRSAFWELLLVWFGTFGLHLCSLRYWKLDPAQVYASGPNAWDTAVHDASEEYKHRMHNLCCDNCHSHVALALNLMRYNNSTNWNMVTLCFFCLLYGKYVSVGAFVKTWLPFILLLGIILTVSLVFNLR